MGDGDEIAVACPFCGGVGTLDGKTCFDCDGRKQIMATLVPNSDAALLMALGEAAMVWLDGGADPEKMRTRFPRVESTAAALRAHREGRGRGAGGGSAAARSRAAALRARLAALTTEEK